MISAMAENEIISGINCVFAEVNEFLLTKNEKRTQQNLNLCAYFDETCSKLPFFCPAGPIFFEEVRRVTFVFH